MGLQTFDIRFRCMGCNHSRARSSPTWAGMGPGDPTWRASHARKGKGTDDFLSVTLLCLVTTTGRKARAEGLEAGFQPLFRDSFHMWLWTNQFPLWNSGLPSLQGRSRAGWVHRCPLSTSLWGEVLRLQKDKRASPQPSGDSNLLHARHIHLLIFSPQNMYLLFFLIMKAVHAYYLKNIYRKLSGGKQKQK